jgi:hypothetical protein
MAARYVVRNGRTGNGSRSLEEALFEISSLPDIERGGFAFCVFRGFFGLSRSKTAGEARRIFKRTDVEEYMVNENRIAPTLRRKSTTSPVALYGVKKEMRDWRADKRRTAVWKQLGQHCTLTIQIVEAHRCNKSYGINL